MREENGLGRKEESLVNHKSWENRDNCENICWNIAKNIFCLFDWIAWWCRSAYLAIEKWPMSTSKIIKSALYLVGCDNNVSLFAIYLLFAIENYALCAHSAHANAPVSKHNCRSPRRDALCGRNGWDILDFA